MKYLTLSILIAVLTTAAFGQQNKIDIGLVGSPSIIFLRGNDIIKQYHKPAVGFSGGLFFQYNFPKIFSIRTDIQFERKGSLVTGTIYYTDNFGNVIDSEKWTDYFHFGYLTMPIIVRATIGKKIKYFFNTGLFSGYLIKQTEIYGATKYLSKKTTDNIDNFKRFDFGATAGLGLIVPIKNKFSISLELCDNFGLYNVSKLAVINDGTVKTNSTNLLIGFAYKLGAQQTETK
ncbi:MAG: PorT family protein [Bacteroidia bacterium]|nr:PorT family protein [Bacteroidia bacterium]